MQYAGISALQRGKRAEKPGNRDYNRAQSATAATTAATNNSCPISTPTLNVNNARDRYSLEAADDQQQPSGKRTSTDSREPSPCEGTLKGTSSERQCALALPGSSPMTCV